MSSRNKLVLRRSRTPNWSIKEKEFLLQLIEESKDIVLLKSNNGPNMSEEKFGAWNNILRQLFDKFGDKFANITVKKVKTQWQNMKRIAREEMVTLGAGGFSKQSASVCKLLNITSPRRFDEDLQQDKDDEMEIPIMNLKQEVEETPKTSHQDSIVIIPQRAIELLPSSSEMSSPASVLCKETNDTYTQTDLVMIGTLPSGITLTDEEKKFRVEINREERLIIKAMRETAELNKIVAEQRLKQILNARRQEEGMYSGNPGDGAGKGGGGGGAIRDAGGSFGKMEAAREDQYFYNKQKEQLKNLKAHLSDEISHHEAELKRHQDAINRHKEKIAQLEKETK